MRQGRADLEAVAMVMMGAAIVAVVAVLLGRGTSGLDRAEELGLAPEPGGQVELLFRDGH